MLKYSDEVELSLPNNKSCEVTTVYGRINVTCDFFYPSIIHYQAILEGPDIAVNTLMVEQLEMNSSNSFVKF